MPSSLRAYEKEKVNNFVNKWLALNVNEGAKPLIPWCDIETTGLDSNADMFIELGIVVTDQYGFVVKDGVFSSIITPDSPVMWDSVNPYVADMHRRSHLADELVDAEGLAHFSTRAVELGAIEFMTKTFGFDADPADVVMAGSSVHFDRRWVETRMPDLSKLFSYRIMDTSSLRRVDQLLFRGDMRSQGHRTIGAHRVIPDIIDSIEEYRALTDQMHPSVNFDEVE